MLRIIARNASAIGYRTTGLAAIHRYFPSIYLDLTASSLSRNVRTSALCLERSASSFQKRSNFKRDDDDDDDWESGDTYKQRPKTFQSYRSQETSPFHRRQEYPYQGGQGASSRHQYNQGKSSDFFSGDYKPQMRTPLMRNSSESSPGFFSESDWNKTFKTTQHFDSNVFENNDSDRPDPTKVYENVTTRFLNVPQNKVVELQKGFVKKFSDIDLNSQLSNNLRVMNIDNMTPVQQCSWVLYGMSCDMLASAQTGSGKTIAFLLPIINQLLCTYPRQAMQLLSNDPLGTQYPSALILAPTRELAQQINQVAKKLCAGTALSCGVFFGGENITQQMNFLETNGCHIAIATPGRIVDHLQRASISLAACQYLVLDEADRMLDMGFEPQIRRIVEDPAHKMPSAEQRSTALFSATFSVEVRKLARDFVRDQMSQNSLPKCVEFVVSDTKNAERGNVLPSNVKHEWKILQSYQDIFGHVLKVVREYASENKRVLIFHNRKSDVDTMDRQLYRQSIRCLSIHGDKTQRMRERALDAFRRGEINTLLATNVAARGLDIPEVGLVINVGLPMSAEDYVHRSGRAGRLGRQGICMNFLISSDLFSSKNIVSDINEVLRRSMLPTIN